MGMEGNDLSTDNIATSDELSASSVYGVGKDTHYAKGKRATQIAVTATSLLVVAGGALGAANFNPFLKGTPVLSSPSFTYENEVLTYSFSLQNEGEFQVTFLVQADKASEPLFTLDISTPQDYAGTVEGIKKGIAYEGKWNVTNGFDYETSQTLFRISEEGEIG